VRHASLYLLAQASEPSVEAAILDRLGEVLGGYCLTTWGTMIL